MTQIIFSQFKITFLVTLSIFSISVAIANDPLSAGKSAFKRGDYTLAFRAFRPLAAEGNSEAQVLIGNLYENGLGVIKDELVALQWYEKAGKLGNAKGQHNAGISYFTGKGVDINYPAAYEWFL